MSSILREIRSILANWVENIDAGNTNISEEEERALLGSLKEISSPYVSTYTAIRMSGKKKSEFYELIRQGKLPKGEHIQGFKEIHFNKAKLIEAIKKLKSEDK